MHRLLAVIGLALIVATPAWADFTRHAIKIQIRAGEATAP